MWVAALTSKPPWGPITLSGSSTTSKAQPQMCLSAAKFRRRSRPSRNHDGDKEAVEPIQNTGVVRQAAVLSAFKSIREQQQQQSHSGGRALKPQRKSQIEEQSGQELERRQLSGSDVLRALRSASVEKAKQSLLKRKKKMKRDDSLKMTSIEGDKMALDDYNTPDTSSTSPLCIKSEWGVRLEELEKRLEEIMLLDV